MKKLLFLAVLGMLTVLVVAPAAMAQDFTPVPDEENPLTLENTCEGIASPEDFEACEAAQQDQYTTSSTVEAPAIAPTATAGVLPDTGGPALLMPLLGVLLVAGGLVMRRR